MRHRIRCAGLPLAVYREIVAHLSQLEGVQADLIPQQSQQFDYSLSQVDSLLIQHSDDAVSNSSQRVQQILSYYGDRYGAWEDIRI